MAARILLVEDSPEVSATVSEALAGQGYVVVTADSAARGRSYFDREAFDLCLFDLALPDGSGLDLTRHVRGHSSRGKTPVILLTGDRDLRSKEAGFEAGADHYLTKPMRVDELFLWVRSLLRRAGHEPAGGGALTRGEVALDPDAHAVRVDPRTVGDLTAKEFALLAALMRACPAVLPRAKIMRAVWGSRFESRTLDVHIQSLRRKLGAQGAIHIVTVKGKGYRFE